MPRREFARVLPSVEGLVTFLPPFGVIISDMLFVLLGEIGILIYEVATAARLVGLAAKATGKYSF